MSNGIHYSSVFTSRLYRLYIVESVSKYSIILFNVYVCYNLQSIH